METPMDLFKRIYPQIQEKHPEWSTKRCISATKYAIDHPNWKAEKKKIKQPVSESKSNQISFEDLMNRGTQYA